MDAQARHIAQTITAAIARHLPWLDRIDSHTREAATGTGIAFMLRALGKGLAFGFNVLIARLLGAEGAGIYFLALTVTLMAATVGRMGLDNALLRFTAAHATRGEWSKVAGVYHQGMRMAIGSCVVTTAFVVICAPWITRRVFVEPSLTEPMRLMAIGILPLVLLMLHAEILKGLKRILLAMLVHSDGLGLPLVSIMLLALLGGSFGVSGAVAAYVGATILMLLIGVAFWRLATPQLRGLRGNFDARLLVATSIPLLVVTVMDLVISTADTVVLGIWTNSESVGIYNVAKRVAMLVSFSLLAVNTIVAPKFAELYAQKDLQALGSLARNAARLTILITSPFLAPIVFAPTWVLGLFGPEFTAGAPILVVMVVGHFVNTVTGSVGNLLIMTGHEKLMRNNTIGAALVNVALNLALVPRYGIYGAAIAFATSLAAMNLFAAFLVYRKLSIITLPLPERFLGCAK